MELSDAEYERLIRQKWRGNMLYPQENKIRGIIDLNGVWDFALGTTEEPKDTVTLPDQMEPIAVRHLTTIRRMILLTGIITVMRITGEILQCLLITRDRDWCFALTQ